MEDYRAIADAVAADIAAGRLGPGDRLPPQRHFARRHRVAVSTATRVYRELARRGLTVGEVGRGTFVRAARGDGAAALAEPGTARVDLELAFPMVEQTALMAPVLAELGAEGALLDALGPVGVAGRPADRAAVADLLARDGWRPPEDRTSFTGSGREAIAAALAAIAAPGDRIGVEPLTYPAVLGIATRLGLDLVPLETDELGVTPEAVRQAHRQHGLRGLYLQPVLHNPLGVSWSAARRTAVAELLVELDLPLVEDGVYAFLQDAAPVAAQAPDHVIHVDSMSKRLAPGLAVGVVVAPSSRRQALLAASRSGGWGPSRFALTATTRWITEGVADVVVAAKREDAAVRQAVAAEVLRGFDVRADPQSYHCWWRLPEPWRADTFVAAAARRGIGVTPAAGFAVNRGQAPTAVRLALAAPSRPDLRAALGVLATLARSTDDLEVE